MVPSNAAPAKVCVSCQVDVTNAPRMKDPQGRYYCQACASKASKASPAKPISVVAPAVSGNQDFMAKIIDEAAEKASHVCPGCQHPIAPNAKLCTSCGFNIENGKRAQTRVERVAKESSVKSVGKLSDSPIYQFFAWGDWGLATVALVPLLLTAPLAFLDKDLFAIYGLVWAVVTIACTILTAIDAFRNAFSHGLWILISVFIFSGLYVPIYGIFVSDSSRIKWLNVVNVVAFLGFMGIAFLTPGLWDEIFNAP